MCKSHITGHKLLKLYLQFLFYAVIFYIIFCISGHDRISLKGLIITLTAFKSMSVAGTFVSAFLIFYLLIPFLNILLQNITKRQHEFLLTILLTIYSILPSAGFNMPTNYVSWFCVLFILASYLRFYSHDMKVSHNQWGWITLISIISSTISMIAFYWFYKSGHSSALNSYFLMADCNKILALITATSSFMWFKDIRIPHSRIINALGAATFGVLLIHDNSRAMHEWLWREVIRPTETVTDSLIYGISYLLFSVIVIFIICCGIEWFRQRFIEPRYLNSITNFINGLRLKFKI